MNPHPTYFFSFTSSYTLQSTVKDGHRQQNGCTCHTRTDLGRAPAKIVPISGGSTFLYSVSLLGFVLLSDCVYVCLPLSLHVSLLVALSLSLLLSFLTFGSFFSFNHPRCFAGITAGNVVGNESVPMTGRSTVLYSVSLLGFVLLSEAGCVYVCLPLSLHDSLPVALSLSLLLSFSLFFFPGCRVQSNAGTPTQ